jgi:cytochrome P450
MLVSELDIPFVKNTYTRFEQREETFSLRGQTWIGKNNIGYVLFRHEDINNILKDSRWHTAIGLLAELNSNLPMEFKQRRKKGLMALNGEAHLRLKKLVMPAFTAKHSDNLRPFMVSLMNELIDSLDGKSTVDLQKDIFNYYPIPILCKLFGIPDADWKMFSDWSHLMFNIFNLNGEINHDKVSVAQKEFDEYTSNLINEKRKNLTDDLLSNLIISEENGDKLSTEELIMLIEIIIASGIDTTRCQLGLSSKTILKNNLEKNNIKESLDDVIRHDSVLRGTVRIASEDIVYNNVLFPKGTLVYLNVVSGNFDPKVFFEPNSIMEKRTDIAKTLSFGSGLHYCLGHALAKAEIEEGLKVLFDRLAGRITSWEAVSLPVTSVINGLESLKVELNANISTIS